MNPINLFKFLEKEKGKIPSSIEIKLIIGLPLTPDELDIKEDLSLYKSQITSLPPNLKVEGFLDLENTLIKSLPQGLQVGDFLDIRRTEIASLPPDLKVEGNLYIAFTPLAKKQTSEIRAMLTKGYINGDIYK